MFELWTGIPSAYVDADLSHFIMWSVKFRHQQNFLCMVTCGIVWSRPDPDLWKFFLSLSVLHKQKITDTIFLSTTRLQFPKPEQKQWCICASHKSLTLRMLTVIWLSPLVNICPLLPKKIPFPHIYVNKAALWRLDYGQINRRENKRTRIIKTRWPVVSSDRNKVFIWHNLMYGHIRAKWMIIWLMSWVEHSLTF